MDTFCGLGLPELVIITLVGFVLIGPERGREMALKLGKLLSRVMKSPWWREFNQVTNSLRNLPTTLVRMAELEETQEDLKRELRDIEQQARDIGNEARVDIPKTGTPDSWAAQANAKPAEANPWNIKAEAPSEPAQEPPETPPPAPSDQQTTPPPAANSDDEVND